MLNNLEHQCNQAISVVYNWDDYDYTEGGDVPTNISIMQRYHLEAEKVNKYYMGVFYYDDTLTMNTRHKLEIKIRNFNKNLFGMDTAEEIETFSDETSPLAEYPFLYYRVHEANTAFGLAKNMKMQRSLRSASKTMSQRSKTDCAVSVFMGNCDRATPELLRTTMEFVGPTGY